MELDDSVLGELPPPPVGLRRYTPSGRSLRLDFVLESTARLALPVWFLIISVDRVITLVMQGRFGLDLRLYRAAAIVALDGGNPWSAFPGGGFFAAPPPTLLFYLPTAFVSLPVATAVAMIIGIGSALWIIRRLDLPWWWLAFPPLVESIVVGNPDAAVLALVLVAGPLAGLGAALKVYAAIPLLAQRRWRALAVTVGVFALSLPLWPDYLASLETVRQALAAQAVTLSAWASWVLVPAIVALYALRRHGSEWLVVPAMWPYTQAHYATIAMPALKSSRLAAAIMSLAIPLAPVAAVLAFAAQVVISQRSQADPREPYPSTTQPQPRHS